MSHINAYYILLWKVLMKHTTIYNEYKTVFKKLPNQIDFIEITSLQFGSLLYPRKDWKACSVLTVFLDQLGNSCN